MALNGLTSILVDDIRFLLLILGSLFSGYIDVLILELFGSDSFLNNSSITFFIQELLGEMGLLSLNILEQRAACWSLATLMSITPNDTFREFEKVSSSFVIEVSVLLGQEMLILH